MKKIKWQQRRKKKRVSKKLKRFLMKHKLGEIYKALIYSSGSNNYFDFSNTCKGKIGYLKGSRIPDNSHLLFNNEYRKNQGYHGNIGKLISGSEHTSDYIMQKASAILFAKSEFKERDLRLTSKIQWHYNRENYAPKINEKGGSLYGSCMSYSDYSDAIALYEKFGSDIVQLLIVTDDDGLVMGRALFWKEVYERGSSKAVEYMDRVYALNDNIAEMFYMWAGARGIQTYNTSSINGEVRVDIDSEDCVPYFDTFVSYSHGYGINSSNGYYSLQGTDGDTLESSGGCECENCGSQYDSENEGAYTEDTNQSVCDNCYRYCANGCCYLESNCVRIRGDWYHNEDENIIYSEYDSEYYLMDDTVWSEYHNSSILVDDSVICESDEVYYHVDDIHNTIVEIGGEFYLMDDSDVIEIDDDYYLVDDDEIIEINDTWYRKDSHELLEYDDEYYEISGDEVISTDCGEYHYINDDEIVWIDDTYYRKDSPHIYLDEGDCEFKLKQLQSS